MTTGAEDHSALRRKLAAAKAMAGDGAPGADRSWRIMLARAARDAMALPLEVQKLVHDRASLAELLEMPTDRALIAVLEGPGEGLGLVSISAPLLAAMTEVQTIGKVSAQPPAMRKPTRTDAAMVVAFIDMALGGLEEGLADEADLIWAGGFRYASFLDDPRPLGLLLEDITYRVMRAEIAVADGVRMGEILLALPADGRGQRPKSLSHARTDIAAGHAFTSDLAQQIEGAQCVLHGVIHRMICPLSRIMAMQVGEVLPMTLASVERVRFEGLDGQPMAEGRLGQSRGMRAVRLVPPAPMDAPQVQAAPEIVEMPRAVGG